MLLLSNSSLLSQSFAKVYDDTAPATNASMREGLEHHEVRKRVNAGDLLTIR